MGVTYYPFTGNSFKARSPILTHRERVANYLTRMELPDSISVNMDEDCTQLPNSKNMYCP